MDNRSPMELNPWAPYAEDDLSWVGSEWRLKEREEAGDWCWSRREAYLYRRAYVRRRSQAFQQRLHDYFEMQQRCVGGVANWALFYRRHNEGLQPGANVSDCQYLLWFSPDYAGLGNQIMSFVSAATYAMLTNRALLVGELSVLTRAFCNPFNTSFSSSNSNSSSSSHDDDMDMLRGFSGTWMLDMRSFRDMYLNIQKWQPKVGEFFQRAMEKNMTKKGKNTVVYMDLRFNYKEDDWTFFCPEVQDAIAENALFAGFHTDEYLVPSLYRIPDFKDDLDNLFPDRQAFLHIGRTFLHPANFLWRNITRTFHKSLGSQSIRIGIQVRSFYKHDEETAERVFKCAVVISNLLPYPNTTMNSKYGIEKKGNRTVSSLGVFLTSLNSHHLTYMQTKFGIPKMSMASATSSNGSVVSFFSEGHEGVEKRGKMEQYLKAVIEMWLLSFSDSLLTSEFSSFGFVPTALAGVEPFVMNIAMRGGEFPADWRKSRRPECVRGNTEPCFLVPPGPLQCGDDFMPKAADEFEEVEKCRGSGQGIVVIVSSSSSSKSNTNESSADAIIQPNEVEPESDSDTAAEDQRQNSSDEGEGQRETETRISSVNSVAEEQKDTSSTVEDDFVVVTGNENGSFVQEEQ